MRGLAEIQLFFKGGIESPIFNSDPGKIATF